MFSKQFKRYMTIFLAVVLQVLVCLPVFAADSGSRVVRVAFPQVKGLTETAEDGTRQGLVVDYLNEIAKYTGWEYEYVDIDNAEVMLDGFAKGEYELMGGNYYLPGLEKYYAYPDYSTGYSRSSLLARRDDSTIRSNDWESLKGKVIGVYANAKENIRRLREVLTANNVDCTIKEYTFEELTGDGDLYPYLEKGEVDLLLGNLSERSSSLRVVLSFASQPYYIVTNVGNQEILDGLNMALGRIQDSNPDFGTEHYEANFRELGIDIQLNDKERAYVKEKVSVTVAVADGWNPLFESADENGSPVGVVPDILEEVAAFSGLKFTYIYEESYYAAIQAVQQGRADMLGFYVDPEAVAAEQGLALTAPYAALNNIIVRSKSSTYPAEGLTGSIVEGRMLPGDISAAKIRSHANLTEAIAKVDRGEIDFVYGLATRLEQAIQQQHFANLVPVNLVNESSNICFALDRPAVPDLLTILNKAVNSLSAEMKNEVLNRNMISIGTNTFSLIELIYTNPLVFVGILSFILLVIVVAVLAVGRTRVKAAVMQSNLEKAEAQSRAKGEFLSRMSHEIRTPMNAVVGLADLTAMKEDVPEDVRENLSKLRSSSQYLLRLINDILDMSRIESGMLTIADEPMSMNQVLCDLRSMMSAEAQRHGLIFQMETDINHSDLIGDAIRLRQVLTNLLSNAFKFTSPGGTVVLSAAEISGSDTEAAFTFKVTDDGAGIPLEDQQRIFGSFEQGGSNSSQSQGTGLGLAISRNIVSLMGGELKLKSEPGQGSEFYFTITLPVGEAEKNTDIPKSSASLEGVNILLAEDNDLNAEIAVQLLEMQGASVVRCENGRLVTERFRQSTPEEFQVIIMDVQMPEMNGLEATRAIRAMARPDAAAIPIVAMTANSFKEDMDAAGEAGMNAFVTKPIGVGHLCQVLYDVLR